MAETQEKKKNWFARHKVLTVIGAIVLLAIIGGGASGGSKTNNSSGSSNSTSTQSKSKEKQYRFNDRADKQKEDVEVTVGEPATVDGVKMTVVSADYKDSLSDYEKAESGKQYLVANVKIENTSNKTKAYNPLDFRVQTASGQVLDATYGTVTNQLNSGDLVAGGSVSGTVLFSVPVETGHQYIIWKPSAYDAARAIVQVK